MQEKSGKLTQYKQRHAQLQSYSQKTAHGIQSAQLALVLNVVGTQNFRKRVNFAQFTHKTRVVTYAE